MEQWVYCVDFKQSFQDHPYWLYTNHLSEVRLCWCHLRQASNSFFHEKLESIQYNACLAITGAIRRISSENPYHELELASLKSRHLFRKVDHFYKILNEKLPPYLFDLIPNLNRVCETRHSNKVSGIYTRHNYFRNSFFPSTISEWNNLDCKIRNLESLSIFKKNLLNFTRLCAYGIFIIHNSYGIKLLTRLRLGFSHLHDHKFRHCFQDILNPFCECGNDTETTTHFFLHCPSFHTPRQTLLNNIRNMNEQILSHGKNHLIQSFLCGNPNYHLTVNRPIVNATIECLIW